MAGHELALLNIAAMKEPLTSPVMVGFVENIERINTLAENSPGFVWRLLEQEDDAATVVRLLGENMLANLSVWRDVGSLKKYVYESAHAEIMRRRKQWFECIQEAYLVLWWVRKGHRPTFVEAIDRLKHLRAHGTTPEAFTFRDVFPFPD